MGNGPLIEKSVDFAARIVKLHDHLKKNQEYIISRQIIRSGTSIGANINEAAYAQSLADFISKLSIALKETAETEYWLKLLFRSEYISEVMYNSIIADCLEIKKMLISSLNTSKRKLTGNEEKNSWD